MLQSLIHRAVEREQFRSFILVAYGILDHETIGENCMSMLLLMNKTGLEPLCGDHCRWKNSFATNCDRIDAKINDQPEHSERGLDDETMSGGVNY